MLSLFNLLHIISVIVWVGGMIFAHGFLRPAAVESLEPPARLTLWVGVFKRFFPMVWLSVILLPITGYSMLFTIWGSFSVAPLYVHIMNGLGLLMIFIYMYVYFIPYKKLTSAVSQQIWPDGAAALAQIRMLVGTNIIIGILVIIVASGGRFLV